jgi:menaquinone-9 beta-reductase
LEAAEYDLIVAGAGPAGSACAITAARGGAKVLLVEKDKFPRHKVCGEFVSPESLQLLESLLGEQKFSNLNDRPQIASARVFSGRNIISLPISPCARSIARFDLDYALLEAARHAGVDIREQTSVGAVRQVAETGNFEVQTPLSTASARAVVNSTGRWSQLTQPQAINGNKWIGLKAHYREAKPSPTVDLYFFDGGYCGVQPVGPDAVNACAMVRADAAHSLEEVFARQAELWQRSRAWEPLFPAITTSPLYFRSPQPESNGMLMAGDAAAFIDPFAGDGISLALHSGKLAAESLLPYFQGKRSLREASQQYRAAYLKQFAPAFRNAARVRRIVSAPPFIRHVLMALIQIPPIAKAIVSNTRVKN